MPVTADEVIDDILRPFQAAMNEAHITPHLLVHKLAEELEANETKFFHHKGKVVSTRTVKSWDVRQSARIDAQKLLGAYPVEKHELDVKRPITIEIVKFIKDDNNQTAK